MKGSSPSRYARLVQADITLERLTHELGYGPNLNNLPDFRVATAAARSALMAYGTEELEFHHASTFNDLVPRLEIAEALIALHDKPEPAGKERLPRQ